MGEVVGRTEGKGRWVGFCRAQAADADRGEDTGTQGQQGRQGQQQQQQQQQ